MPNSLTKVLPIALVCSTRPPVSVCGTVTCRLTRGFSWQLGFNHFWALGPAITPQAPRADLPTQFIALQAWHLNPITGWSTLLRHPFAQSLRRGTGILTRCPSTTALALALGPTNPTRINLASETSDFTANMFLTRFSLLMPAFSLLSNPTDLTVCLRLAQNAPLLSQSLPLPIPQLRYHA